MIGRAAGVFGKGVVALGIGAGSLVAVAGCGDRTAGGARSSAPASASAGPLAGYVAFTHASGRYEIMMPSKPEPEVKTPLEVEGVPLMLVAVSARRGQNAAFSVHFADYPEPEDDKRFLEDSRDGAIRGITATSESARTITAFGRYPGTEAVASHPQLSKLRLRNFLVPCDTVGGALAQPTGQPSAQPPAQPSPTSAAGGERSCVRLYTLMVLGDVPEAEAVAYFDSMKLSPSR